MNTNKKANLAVKNIRFANTEKVMNCLINDKNKTRNELAKENYISLMTVKHIVDDLIASNIVQESVSNDTEIGRKPKILEIIKEYGNIVCINLTEKYKISFRIYDIYEELVGEGSVDLDESKNYRQTLLTAINNIKSALWSLSSKTVGVAAFVPSAYYAEKDIVNYDLISNFKDLHLKQLLKNEFGLENILVIHDVFSAAKSEYDSLDPENQSQFYAYFGMGIGGFFIHKNMPIMGKDLMAGEFGKMLIPRKEGKYVILEDIASIDSITKKLQEQSIDKSFEECISLYLKGDEAMKIFFEPILDIVAKVMYNLLWVYNPTRLVIDSSCNDYSKAIIGYIQMLLEELKNDAIPLQVEIMQAKHDEHHTMRGCFHMVRSEWVKYIAKVNSN